MQRPQFVRQLSSRIIVARRLNATSIIGLNSARNGRRVRKVQYRVATDALSVLVKTVAVLKASRSSKQLPTNQGDADNTEKHEPHEIHPEDYWMCVAYDQSIAASPK
jgi:hypothetical protein